MESVQLRARGRIVVAEGAFRRGELFWAVEKRARHYIAQGVAEPAGQQVAPEPIMEPAEKKSSGAGRAGRSTGSAPSSPPGAVPQSCASPQEAALPTLKWLKSKLRGVLSALDG